MELKMFDRNPREMNRPDAATLDERYAYHCAAEYRDRGWSVIPLCGKKPLLPSWRAFQQRTSTLGEIAVWFGGPVSDMPGVGIVTGGCSGLVVIDCDAPEDAEYWLTNFAPSPLMVRTGGGGMHVYYRMPESDTIGNRTRLFGRKIDVRGEGGYVCAPPSRHENGTLYQWVSWGDYCLENVPFLDPTWLRPTPPQIANATRVVSSREIRDVAAYIRKIRAISGQNGHNATYRAACILRDVGLSPEETLAELIDWNETNCEPKWSVRELLHKTQSAFARISGSPSDVSESAPNRAADSTHLNSKEPT